MVGEENGKRHFVVDEEVDIVNTFVNRIRIDKKRMKLDGFEKIMLKMKDFSPAERGYENKEEEISMEEERQVIERQSKGGRSSPVLLPSLPLLPRFCI